MDEKKMQQKFIENDLLNLPLLRCASCGAVNKRNVFKTYQQKAVSLGEAVKADVIQELIALKRSGTKGLKKQKALDAIYENGKTKIQKDLRNLFDSLNVSGDCCRELIADTVRKEVEPALYFEAEDYYDFDKFQDEWYDIE